MTTTTVELAPPCDDLDAWITEQLRSAPPVSESLRANLERLLTSIK